jgi:tRNA threonylcarbamoyladenosine biosynthesis protein TsaE
VVALRGELGAGKTALARAVIQALPLPDGAPAEEDVPSPTFTLVQTYARRPAPVWHIDLYRLSEPDEVIELGWDEALADGIVLVEWPDRAGTLLPAARLDVELADTAAGGRTATLTDGGGWSERLREVAGNG